MEVPISALLPTIGALAGVVVGAFLNYRLSYTRFSREKLWEKRLEVYSEILVELQRTEQISASVAEDLDREGERVWNDKGFQTHMARVADHLGKARNRFALNALVVSPTFRARFQQLEEDIESLSFKDLLPPEEYEQLTALLRAARPELDTLARKEVTN